MKSNRELVNALRAAPEPWLDTAIVVAFENRFEFVGEDHPDPMSRLKSLEEQGGLPIGLAGVGWVNTQIELSWPRCLKSTGSRSGRIGT